MGAPQTDQAFLVHEASSDELVAATGANHRLWLERMAAAGGGFVEEAPGGAWAYLERPAPEVVVAVTEPAAGGVRELLDAALRCARGRTLSRVGCWSLRGDGGALGAWLAARGFRWGSAPHWMAVDMTVAPTPGAEGEEAHGQRMSVWDDLAGWDVPELPCLRPEVAPVREAMCRARPRRVWQAIVAEDGRPVGQVALAANPGPLGVVGLYDAVILPSSRVPGVGRWRFRWLYQFARELGARYVVANVAEHAANLYSLAGFRSLARGQTWFLPGGEVRREHDPARVALAEAVGCGDLQRLAALRRAHPGLDLGAPLPNRMSPLQLAGATGQQAAGRWLVEHGAPLDVLGGWALGWRDEVAALLRADPAVRDQRRPRSGKTLLHVAAERGDVELARLLLDCGADPAAVDARHGATPLDWARHLRRVRVAALLRRALRARGAPDAPPPSRPAGAAPGAG